MRHSEIAELNHAFPTQNVVLSTIDQSPPYQQAKKDNAVFFSLVKKCIQSVHNVVLF